MSWRNEVRLRLEFNSLNNRYQFSLHPRRYNHLRDTALPSAIASVQIAPRWSRDFQAARYDQRSPNVPTTFLHSWRSLRHNVRTACARLLYATARRCDESQYASPWHHGGGDDTRGTAFAEDPVVFVRRHRRVKLSRGLFRLSRISLKEVRRPTNPVAFSSFLYLFVDDEDDDDDSLRVLMHLHAPSVSRCDR